eukprot:5931767-Amphidinium_carterae.1
MNECTDHLASEAVLGRASAKRIALLTANICDRCTTLVTVHNTAAQKHKQYGAHDCRNTFFCTLRTLSSQSADPPSHVSC